MKKSQLIFSTIALPLDYLMLVAAGWLAYQLRFESFIRASLPVQFDLPWRAYLPTLLGAALVWLILLALSGLYNLRNQLKFSQELGRIFLACTSGLALIILLFFFNPNLFNSRFIILVGWVLSLIMVSGGRLLLRLLRTSFYKRGVGVNYLLLVGEDAVSHTLEHFFKNSPQFGFYVTKRVSPSELDLDRDTMGVDEVWVGEAGLPRQLNLQILEFCLSHHLGFRYVADIFEAKSHNVITHTLGGVPLIEIKRTPLDGWGRVIKRIFDLILAVILLIILSPVLVFLALLVILDSGWPVVVALPRVGEGGRIFKMYKFRSMIKNADQLKTKLLAFNERADGPLFKMANDPRVTPLGKILRRTSLDELPQLWNVIKGQMSLVGPRPHEPAEVANYELHHRRLLNIKPGITGLAQVSGRSTLSFEEEARLDIFYVEHWSLWQDLIILFKTLIVVWQRRWAV